MKLFFTTFLLFLSYSLLLSQFHKASVQEDYTYKVEEVQLPNAQYRSTPNEFKQIANFPKAHLANSNIKNFRNVSLEDITGDGVQDIIFVANNRLLVYSKGILLWEKTLLGVGTYPPSIADINNDGTLEIVQATGGPRERGRIYVVNTAGQDLAGWPRNYEDHWILTAPSLSDVDGDGTLEIAFIERINSNIGNVHLVTADGNPYNQNWPVSIPGTPAVTPSIGDVDNDGTKEIVVYSTTIMYQFDLEGNLEPGWPIDNPNTRFSFQAPILADLDQNGDLEIIGASHGNIPEYYVLNHDGTPYKTWPILVPQQSWTFSSPTVVPIDNELQIFMSRPNDSSPSEANKDMLYAWKEDGRLEDAFPIEKIGGLDAGIITVANIDQTEDYELLFGSNMIGDSLTTGFIHAYKMDGSGELPGFPLRPLGWTLQNGAAIGDVTGDGRMNLVALSYSLNFGAAPDSLYLNIYDLEESYAPEKVLWSNFKGNNTRDGLIAPNSVVASLSNTPITGLTIQVQPNPIKQTGFVQMTLTNAEFLSGTLYNLVTGQEVLNLFDKVFSTGTHQITLPKLPVGIYSFSVSNRYNHKTNSKILVTK